MKYYNEEMKAKIEAQRARVAQAKIEYQQQLKERMQQGYAESAELLATERVSVRRKYVMGKWMLMLYRYNPESPTGVLLGGQIPDNAEGRALVAKHGYTIYSANSMRA